VSATSALSDYRKDSDSVQLFLEEKGYESSQIAAIEKGTLYREFRDWCQENGFNQFNISTFGKRVKALGIGEFRKSNSRMWRLGFRGRDVQAGLYVVGSANTTPPATEVHYNI
jgi:phage/plasmid-associated DNA primase